MMIRRMLLVAALVAAGMAFGAPRATAGEGAKVGVIRIQQVFKDYVYAREMEKKIKESFAHDEKQIQDLQRQIQQLKEELQANPEPSGALARERILQIQIFEVRLEEKVRRYRKFSRARMAEFWRTVYKDFQQAVNILASQQRYDIIITAPDIDLSEEVGRSDAPEAIQNEILLRYMQYISPRVDLTDQVIQMMNQLAARKATGGGN